uniref:Ig-like domain-containing protein n=1 Tax=Sphaeramia orbicularis TaxID=375764 RepID=A0A672ZB54_9TELE
MYKRIIYQIIKVIFQMSYVKLLPLIKILLTEVFSLYHCSALAQSQPITAVMGDDITLPCHVTPVQDVSEQMVEWSKLRTEPRFVHVRRSGEDRLVDQNPEFSRRTSMSLGGLTRGDVSLTLSRVRLSDEGTYRCFIPSLKMDTTVQLHVEVVPGDDVILPCHVEPVQDVVAMTIEWSRPDLDPMFVYLWRARQDNTYMKNPMYTGRTSLSVDELKKGNMSLKLTNVQLSDRGTYTCLFLANNLEMSVELIMTVCCIVFVFQLQPHPLNPSLNWLESANPVGQWCWSVCHQAGIQNLRCPGWTLRDTWSLLDLQRQSEVLMTSILSAAE